MAEALINRVYDLRIAGYDDTIQKIEALTLAFQKLDDSKKKLNAQLQEKQAAGDTDAINILIKKIKDLEAEMQKLKTQRDSTAKEAALLAKAESSTADALLKTEKATVQIATAEKIRSQTRISENKEIQRKIDIENKQRQSLEAEKLAVDALEGSYLKLKSQRQALEKLTASGNQASTFKFEDQTLNFDEAISKIKEIKVQEQEYLDKLKVEKQSQADIIKTLQEKIVVTKQERLELEKIISTTAQTQNVSFKGQDFKFDEAISKIKQMEALEVDFTERLRQEQTVHDNINRSQEERILSIRRQRTELETLVKTGATLITTDKGTLSRDEALTKINQLQAEETTYIDQLNREKAIRESMIKTEQEKINLIKIERQELESIVKTSQQTTTVKFRGEDFNYSEAITKVTQLEQAETELTAKLNQQGIETKELSGNFYGLLAAQKAALELYRTTLPDSPIFEEVKQGAIDATNKVQAFNRSLSPDGTLVGEYKSGIINAFKELGLSDVLRKQRDEVNANLTRLKNESQGLAAEYRKTGTAGKEAFQKIEGQLTQNLNQQEQMKKSLVSLDAALGNTGTIGSQISTGIANGFKNAKVQLSQLVLGYIGFQAIFSGLQSSVGITKELSDQTTNLEIELGKAAGGAKDLVDQLAKIDTRTKLVVLEQIANIAVKADVSEENLVGVTQSLDKIKIAFGKDFGDVEKGTESLIKLVNIFEGTDQVTGENLLRVGNAVRTLANESVASVPFLNDFSQRMAGLKGISDISLPAVLGLASGFEQFAQSSEVAGTALTKIIPKLATDTEKYGKIAGLTQQAFSDLLKNNPAEALIKVSEGLVKSGSGLEEISTAFADSELGSGRIAAVLGVVAANANEFRKSIASAGEAYQNTGNIEAAFAAKNENLAATLDKISKRFADAANSKGFQLTLIAISSVITFLLGNIPLLITLLGVLTISYAAQNAALLLLRAQLIGYNILIGLSTIAQGALTIANGIYVAGLFLLNGAYAIVSRAAALFNLTLGRTPIGLILTGIGLLITAYKVFGTGLNNVVKGFEELSEKARINRDVMREAAKATSEQRAEVSLLTKVINDLTISEETRIATLKKLIDQHPEFSKALKDDKINYDELNIAVVKFNENIKRTAELQAASARNTREFQKLTELTIQRQDIEFAKTTKDFSGLTEEEAELLDLTMGLFDTLIPSEKEVEAKVSIALAKLNTEINKQTKIIDASQLIFIEKQKKIDEAAKLAREEAERELKKNAPIIIPIEIDITKLKEDITKADAAIEKFGGTQKELDKLLTERAKLQARLDAALGTGTKAGETKEFRGSRLTGELKDELKVIDTAFETFQKKLEIALLTQTNFEKDNQVTLIDNERIYLQKSLELSDEFLTKKINTIKGDNAEENKTRADLELKKIQFQKDINQKLFDIDEKAARARKELTIKNAQQENQLVQDDPNATAISKVEAKIKADEIILQAEIDYSHELDRLQKERHLQSLKNEQDAATAIRDTKLKLIADLNQLDQSQFDNLTGVVKFVEQYKKSTIEIQTENKKLSILNDKRLSESQKQIAIQKLEETSALNTTNTEIEATQKLILLYQVKLGLFAAFNKEYQELVKQLQKLIVDQKVEINAVQKRTQDQANRPPGGQNTEEFLTTTVTNTFSLNDKESQLAGFVIGESFSLAGDAMNSYFDAERQRIEESLKLAEQRIELEAEQLKARAQSQEEIESIDKQAAAKKRTAEREAGEQLKKVKRSEAKIALASELANIAVAAAGNPANAFTFGVAGAIMYAVLAALAFTRYALNVSNINREQFEKGGTLTEKIFRYGGNVLRNIFEYGSNVTEKIARKVFGYGGSPDMTTTRGGILKGRSHRDGGNPFIFKGRLFEDEIEEIEVIRTKNVNRNLVHTISGTHAQIASQLNILGGGVEFQPGAKYKPGAQKFETGGSLWKQYETGGYTGLTFGDNLLPPINPQAYLNPGANAAQNANTAKTDEKLNKLMGLIAETSRQTNQRIDKLQVVLNPNEVQKHNDKTRKATQIGTL